MSASNTRRRLALLTGAAALAMAGSAWLVPAAAFAANECGDPGANTTTADVFTCAGSFAAITYPTTNGNLTLNLQNNVTATSGGLVVTVTPLATTTVSIARLADSPANSGDPSLTSTSTINAALQVTRDAGGSITVNLTDTETTDTPMTISGVAGGVKLQNAGTSATSFTSTNGTISASAGAGIEATSTGTGSVTVTSGSAVTGSTWGIRAGTTGSGSVTIANSGTVSGATGAVLVTGGTNATLTNAVARSLTGVVTLNNTGVVTFTNNGAWTFSGTSALGTGATTLTNVNGGVISTNVAAAASTMDFGTGADTFVHRGVLAVGTGAQGAATLTVLGLEAWNNSGRVVFGAAAEGPASDGVPNDRIVAAGTLFTGAFVNANPVAGLVSSDSMLVMDVDFAADQADCSAAVNADCLDLRGSSTAGSTDILVTSVGGDMAMADRLVLIDVGGAGTSAAGHFTLSSFSTDYREVGGVGVIDSGLFFYALEYDPAAKQHALTATAFNGRALKLARIGRAASEPWRAAAGLWFERQADLRQSLQGREPGAAPGAWLKVAGNFITESRYDTVDVGAGQAEYNTSFDQRTTALVGGVDLVQVVGAGSAWVLGLTAGRLESSLDYAAATSELELDGNSFGAYATWVAGSLFVDAIVGGTRMDLTHHDLGQAFEGAASTFGYQVEGGWRVLEINEGVAYVEPVGAVSYLRTDVDDMTIGPVTTRFDEATSLRAALGLRVAGDVALEALTAQFSFTGRVWKELESENQTTLSASFGDTALSDSGPDTLADLGVAIGLFTLGERLSANLGYGVKFKDGYRSTDASLSVRFSW